MPFLLWALTSSDLAKFGWESDLRRYMKRILPRTPEIAGDSETPTPPESLHGRKTFLRWRHNQIFSAWWVTNFLYRWCFAGAFCTLKLRYGFMKFLIWARGEGRRRRERYKFALHVTMKNNRFARFARALSKTWKWPVVQMQKNTRPRETKRTGHARGASTFECTCVL